MFASGRILVSASRIVGLRFGVVPSLRAEALLCLVFQSRIQQPRRRGSGFGVLDDLSLSVSLNFDGFVSELVVEFGVV